MPTLNRYILYRDKSNGWSVADTHTLHPRTLTVRSTSLDTRRTSRDSLSYVLKSRIKLLSEAEAHALLKQGGTD